MDSIKHYIILIMNELGLQVDSDTHIELDEARIQIKELEERLRSVEEVIAWMQHSANNS